MNLRRRTYSSKSRELSEMMLLGSKSNSDFPFLLIFAHNDFRNQIDPSAASQAEKSHHPPPSPVNPSYAHWQVRDVAQSSKPSKKLETGSSTWSRDNGELTGSPGVQEIEQKTSGITLEHDIDVRMNDADQVDTVRSPRNGRKRTGTDSAVEGGSFPAQQSRESHAGQSPKRTRAQTTKRVEMVGRGSQGLYPFPSDSSKNNR